MPDRRLPGTWIRRFLLEHIVTERNLSENTQHSYRDIFTILLPYVSTRKRKPIDRLEIADLSDDTLKRFLGYLEQERKCSIRSRNQRLGRFMPWPALLRSIVRSR